MHCTACHAATDLRFAFGHGWRDGNRIVRAGTDETIAYLAEGRTPSEGELRLGGAADPSGPASPAGRSFCADCIADHVEPGPLRVPDGLVYDRAVNRSVLPSSAVGSRLDMPDESGPIRRARVRYGDAAFEWRTLEAEGDCASRLDQLDVLVRSR